MLGSNRYAVYFASPLTNGYGEAYSGGNLAPQFAKTGFKVVIVEGKADAPVYLEVSEAGVAFHSAADLWGLDAFEAEDKILARTEHKKAQACVIGQAGENLVRFACVNNNKWHQLGRGGPGAVFGSKKLKGIVWHGDTKVEVARPDDFKAVVRDIVERTKDDPGVAAYQRGGTLNMVRIMNGKNAFPTRYWRKGTVEGFENITVETMLEKHGTRNEVCPPCVMKCVKHNFVFEGRHKGLECEGPEYETAYVFGGLCEIVDFAELMWLNDLCDRWGVDTMTAGNLCALAHRGGAARPHRRGDGLRRPRLRRRVPAQDVLPRGHRRRLGRGYPAGREGVWARGRGRALQGHGAGGLRAAGHEGHGSRVRDDVARRLSPAGDDVQARADRVSSTRGPGTTRRRCTATGRTG